jgi:hypothetical protein
MYNEIPSLADEGNHNLLYFMTLNQRKKIRLYNKHRQVENTRSGLFENNVWVLH